MINVLMDVFVGMTDWKNSGRKGGQEDREVENVKGKHIHIHSAGAECISQTCTICLGACVCYSLLYCLHKQTHLMFYYCLSS